MLGEIITGGGVGGVGRMERRGFLGAVIFTKDSLEGLESRLCVAGRLRGGTRCGESWCERNLDV